MKRPEPTRPDPTRPEPTGVRRVAVIGTGLVGTGWAAYFLARGLSVSAYDPAEGAHARLRRGVERLWPSLARLGLEAGADPQRLSFHRDLEAAVAGAEFVQENTPEDPEHKAELFRRLDLLLPPKVIVASSSSSLLMTPLQRGCRHPERFLLGHPFNPVHLLPLVEVSGGKATSPEALSWAVALYWAIGKRPVRLRREIQGHIAGRLSAALYREAVHLVAEGVASVEDVDAAMVYGPGMRLALYGPHLNYHLGGGEGGLRHYLKHLGPAQERRWADLGQPRLTPELQARLVQGVEEEAAGKSVAELERERDEGLEVLLQALRRGG